MIPALTRTVLTVAFAGIAGNGWGLDSLLSLAGSTTAQPVVERAAKQFEQAHPGIKCKIEGGGSGEGVKAVGTRRVDIGMCSRELKEAEAAAYPQVIGHPIGFDGIVILVHADNPIREIKYDQVRDIYRGALTNWKQLGGNDGPIVRFARHDDSASQDMFLEYFKVEAKISGPKEKSVSFYRAVGDAAWGDVSASGTYTKGEMLDGVTGDRNSIGFVSLVKAENALAEGARLKLLNLDGVVASRVNLANESYPLRRTLQLVTHGEPSGSAKLFMEFILSPPGQKIVEEMEYIPVKP